MVGVPEPTHFWTIPRARIHADLRVPQARPRIASFEKVAELCRPFAADPAFGYAALNFAELRHDVSRAAKHVPWICEYHHGLAAVDPLRSTPDQECGGALLRAKTLGRQPLGYFADTIDQRPDRHLLDGIQS